MVDMVAMQCAELDMASFARQICAEPAIGGSDGLLYVVRVGEHYAMRMFNPDGSEAEMCGNGIRCVARLVEERYEKKPEFILTSGGGLFPTARAEQIAEGIKAYGVDIAVRTASADFGFATDGEPFIAKVIPSLDENLRFTERQNDRLLKEKLPRSVGAQYATGNQWTNNSRKNEEIQPKQKHLVVDVGS